MPQEKLQTIMFFVVCLFCFILFCFVFFFGGGGGGGRERVVFSMGFVQVENEKQSFGSKHCVHGEQNASLNVPLLLVLPWKY